MFQKKRNIFRRYGKPQARKVAQASNSSTPGLKPESLGFKVSLGYMRLRHKHHHNHHILEAVKW